MYKISTIRTGIQCNLVDIVPNEGKWSNFHKMIHFRIFKIITYSKPNALQFPTCVQFYKNESHEHFNTCNILHFLAIVIHSTASWLKVGTYYCHSFKIWRKIYALWRFLGLPFKLMSKWMIKRSCLDFTIIRQCPL